MNLATIKSATIYILGLAAVVIGAIPAVSLPTSVHAVLVAVGGVIVAVERYLQGQIAIAAAAAAHPITAELLAAESAAPEIHVHVNEGAKVTSTRSRGGK